MFPIGLDEERIRVRQRHRKVVQLALNAADHPERLAKINLGIARRVRQRHEHRERPVMRFRYGAELVHRFLRTHQLRGIPIEPQDVVGMVRFGGIAGGLSWRHVGGLLSLR